jgi:hypothetical protein
MVLNALSGPPTMIVSDAAFAPTSPPETRGVEIIGAEGVDFSGKFLRGERRDRAHVNDDLAL